MPLYPFCHGYPVAGLYLTDAETRAWLGFSFLLARYRSTKSLCCVLRYVLAFSLGAGPVPALLLPEIFGARIRAKAVSVSLGVHWVSTPNFLLSWLRMWSYRLVPVGRVEGSD